MAMDAERDAAVSLDATLPVSHPFRGALLCVLGVFFFACLDSTTKYLVASYEVPLVAAIRYLVNCALMAAIIGPRYGVQLVQTQRTGLVVLRGLSLTGVTLFVSLALQRMPVAETTSILFVAPLLVVILAGPLLGERVRPLNWIAAITGFSGVLLIARPGGGLEPAGILFAALAATANVAYQLLSRVLVHTERMVALLFHGTLVGSICFGIALPWFLTGDSPSALQLLLFLNPRVSAWLAHYSSLRLIAMPRRRCWPRSLQCTALGRHAGVAGIRHVPDA